MMMMMNSYSDMTLAIDQPMRARATCFIYMKNLQTRPKTMYLDTRTRRETHNRVFFRNNQTNENKKENDMWAGLLLLQELNCKQELGQYV